MTRRNSNPTAVKTDADTVVPPIVEIEADDHEPEDGNGPLDMSEFIANADEGVPPVADGFDCMEDFVLAQDFNPNEVEEEPPVACKRPPRDDYFRVHPDSKMTATVGIYEPEGGRDVYLVKPAMFGLFGNLVSKRQLYVCLTSLGETFLWAAKLPRDDRRGGGDRYNKTALKAAEQAKTRWTRMASDEVKKCYRIYHPEQEGTGQYGEPDWSNTAPLIELMRLAFGDGFMISDKSHPEARRIRGAVK